MADKFTTVTGIQQVINNLMLKQSKFLRAIAEAVEKVSVDVANNAKAGHGADAHAQGRYRNQTGNLTRSITQELSKVDYESVEATVFAPTDYALAVEMRYPFLWPALVGNEENLKRRITESLA
jgi:hypothetical protein